MSPHPLDTILLTTSCDDEDTRRMAKRYFRRIRSMRDGEGTENLPEGVGYICAWFALESSGKARGFKTLLDVQQKSQSRPVSFLRSASCIQNMLVDAQVKQRVGHNKSSLQASQYALCYALPTKASACEACQTHDFACFSIQGEAWCASCFLAKTACCEPDDASYVPSSDDTDNVSGIRLRNWESLRIKSMKQARAKGSPEDAGATVQESASRPSKGAAKPRATDHTPAAVATHKNAQSMLSDAPRRPPRPGLQVQATERLRSRRLGEAPSSKAGLVSPASDIDRESSEEVPLRRVLAGSASAPRKVAFQASGDTSSTVGEGSPTPRAREDPPSHDSNRTDHPPEHATKISSAQLPLVLPSDKARGKRRAIDEPDAEATDCNTRPAKRPHVDGSILEAESSGHQTGPADIRQLSQMHESPSGTPRMPSAPPLGPDGGASEAGDTDKEFDVRNMNDIIRRHVKLAAQALAQYVEKHGCGDVELLLRILDMHTRVREQERLLSRPAPCSRKSRVLRATLQMQLEEMVMDYEQAVVAYAQEHECEDFLLNIKIIDLETRLKLL